MFLRSVETTSLPIGGTKISDGEDHDSRIKEAINKAKKVGLKIIAAGIGTPNGSPIPVKDESGIIKDYIKDRTGQIVVSKINVNLLKSVASETGGKYFDASVKDISGELSRAVRDFKKNKNKISERDSKIDRFQIFLFVALLLLFIELVFPVKRLRK
jgi:Ca-activated chloride channel family protein